MVDRVSVITVQSESLIFSGHGSDRSDSPKIKTGPKILTGIYGTTSNLPIFDQFWLVFWVTGPKNLTGQTDHINPGKIG